MAATTAVSKLMLTSVIDDKDLLKQVVICYFDPDTRENAGVRQALSYFLPVYCHSKADNMERMADIVPDVMHTITAMNEALEEGDDMVGLGIVGNMLVDWTDARKLVIQGKVADSWEEAGTNRSQIASANICLNLVDSLLKGAMNSACSSKLIPVH